MLVLSLLFCRDPAVKIGKEYNTIEIQVLAERLLPVVVNAAGKLRQK